jgi:two-component system, chemotaxis family, sensor histidine kinase and response regulator WspE
MTPSDLSGLSMLELFRLEAESQTRLLTTGLLALERDPTGAGLLESCMRAAHSLKGAARIVGLHAGVSVTHAMEDCFVAAQHGRVSLRKAHIDLLLQGVDLMTDIAGATEAEAAVWADGDPPAIGEYVAALAMVLAAGRQAPDVPLAVPPAVAPAVASEAEDRVLRVTANHLDRLLGLAGESLVESRWLQPFTASLLRLKRLHHAAGEALDVLRETLAEQAIDEQSRVALAHAQRTVLDCQQSLAQRLAELETYDRRATTVAHRLYEEALACRMRPFADGVQTFPRMVRDLAHTLGKKARLEIVGLGTQIDRDMLARLEAPLTHLLRNAVDHGIDSPSSRVAAGKPEEGVVRLEARHAAGRLLISVSDDGPGIDTGRVRQAIVQRGLADGETAAKLGDDELLEFLFLPGFTLKDAVTEISGRGVGLDAVQDVVKHLRGSVRVSSRMGMGARFEVHLPLTVSVVRTLLAEIGGELYAFPLAHLDRAMTIARSDVETLEGRQHFRHGERQIGLVTASQVLGGEAGLADEQLPVIIAGDHAGSYGLIVERFLGIRELVVQPLDPRLGKIKDIAAGALLADGSPVLIVDVDDLIRSMQKLTAIGHLSNVQYRTAADQRPRRKRVLVVDDSLTVRELERKLIDSGGYEVEVAVDGIDGWNAVRASDFDLVVTDIDMPRMDGIELLRLIRKDSRLKALPVMIVSYKDREDDRRRGLDAGADFYLAKGSFHNESLLQAVLDLVGEA